MSRIKKIIQKYCQITNPNLPEVERDFTYWLTCDKNEQEKDEALFAFWTSMEVTQDSSTLVAYEKVLKKINLHTPIKKKSKRLTSWIKYAAAIALVVGSISILFLLDNHKQDVLVEFMVPEGSTSTLILSDSSLVHLGSKSVFKYPSVFPENGSRQVYLSGNAFFSIQHIDNKPFMVQTGKLRVKVLGTKFTLSCSENQELSTLILKEGKVEVSIDDRSIVMIPDQKLIYDNNDKSLEVISVASNEGSLSLKSATIQDVIKNLEHRYSIKVYLETNKYNDDKITVQFSDNDSLSDCLNILSLLVTDLHYKIRDGNVYLE